MSNQPARGTRTGVKVGIAVLSIAVVALLALIGYLLLDHSAPTEPSPTPSTTAPETASETPAASPTPEPDPTTPAPEPDPTTPAPESDPTSPEPRPGQTMMWQGKATFDNFTVELLEDTGDGEMVDGRAGLPVEVCVTAALEEGQPTRISLEPWSLTDSNGNTQRPQDPGAYEPAFPADGTYAEGECASGYLTFDLITDPVDYVELVYSNGLGDRAVWQFH